MTKFTSANKAGERGLSHGVFAACNTLLDDI